MLCDGTALDNKSGIPISGHAPVLRQSIGGATMVKQPRQFGSAPPDVDGFEEATTGHQVPPYELRESAASDRYPDDFVPLFRSDYHGEPDPSEYINPLRSKQRASLSSRILAGVCAAAAAAILVALLSLIHI